MHNSYHTKTAGFRTTMKLYILKIQIDRKEAPTGIANTTETSTNERSQEEANIKKKYRVVTGHFVNQDSVVVKVKLKRFSMQSERN